MVNDLEALGGRYCGVAPLRRLGGCLSRPGLNEMGVRAYGSSVRWTEARFRRGRAAFERHPVHSPSCVFRGIQRPLSRGDDARRGSCSLPRWSGANGIGALPRPTAIAYSTESMRLTTRLMQVASWLLLQRAVNEGELTARQAQAERVRVKFSREDYGCRLEIFEQLPSTLRSLSQRSVRIQERVMHLDQSLVVAHSPEPVRAQSGVASQVERLRAAFSQ